MPRTEESTSRLRDWWSRAMTDPNPACRAEALEHLRALTDGEGPVPLFATEGAELKITKGILAFIEENLNPVQEESCGSEVPIASALHW